MSQAIVGAIISVLVIAGAYLAVLVLRVSFFDRLLAVNGIGTKVATLVILVGLLYGRLDMFVDIAIALFMLNFVATLLIAKYARGKGAVP